MGFTVGVVISSCKADYNFVESSTTEAIRHRIIRGLAILFLKNCKESSVVPVCPVAICPLCISMCLSVHILLSLICFWFYFLKVPHFFLLCIVSIAYISEEYLQIYFLWNKSSCRVFGRGNEFQIVLVIFSEAKVTFFGVVHRDDISGRESCSIIHALFLWINLNAMWMKSAVPCASF